MHERAAQDIKTPQAKAPAKAAAPPDPQTAARQYAVTEAKRALQKKNAPALDPSVYLSEVHDPAPAPSAPPALIHEKPPTEIKTPPPKVTDPPANTTPSGQQTGRRAFIEKAKTESAKRATEKITEAADAPPPITPITDAPRTAEQAARPLTHSPASTPTQPHAPAPAAVEHTTIKTRRRTEPAMKLKDHSRAAVIKTKMTGTAAPGAIKTPNTVNAAANSTAKRTARRIQRQKRSLAIKQLTQEGRRTGKGIILAARKLVKATGKAARTLISALAALGGGFVLIVILCVAILAAAVFSSPMGILAADEASDNGTTLTSAIGQISNEYSAELRSLRAGYDSYNVLGHAPKWKDVIAVYAVKTATSDDGTDVLTLDDEHIARMKAVFWDMTEITSTTSTIFHEDTDPEDEIDDSWTESVITITVTAKTAADMESAYHFNHYQSESLAALLVELDEWDLFAIDLDITDATALAVLENLPANLSMERRIVVQYALSLVGKVTYFWGGKSLVLGIDPRWGQSAVVTSPGSRTTGTTRPYGMDCSGFVDWVFYNASDGGYVISRGGGARSQHYNCYAISWSEAIPGDLVFYPGDEHIGIVVGWDGSGNILICHCASGSQNGVYVTGKVGFTSIARPYYYGD